MSAKKTDAEKLADAQDIIRKKNADLVEATRIIKELRRDDDTAESIRKSIFGLAERTPEPPEWLNGRGGVLGARGAPCTIWSDWHWGERINSDEIGGVNAFDSKIARTRAKRLVDRTIDLAYNHMGRAKTEYPGIVVMLGGDMVGGENHEELMATNDRTVHQSVDDLTDVLAAGIDALATKFGRVFVPCVVGNHGRSTRKPRMKGRVFTNYDWAVYTNLDRYFRKEKHIQFYIPPEADAYFSVFGHRYLLTHGDSMGVRGGDGIIGAIGPIIRGTIKIGRNQSQIGRDVDTFCICHWHQYIALPGLIVNNSFKGFDEYAMLQLRALYSRPSQALWFTHPEHGITAHWQVYLEDQQSVSDSKTWIKWQA
jgi:hypothetical protein